MKNQTTKRKTIKSITTASLFAGALIAGTSHAGAMKADFNGDGYEDLVVGTENDYVGYAGWDAGSVKVVYGRADGTYDAQSRTAFLHQSKAGVGGINLAEIAEAYDNFGEKLAVGDFNNDGYDDLVISTPRETVNGVNKAGIVNIVYGSVNGLVRTNNHLLNLQRIQYGIHMKANGFFGTGLAIGDYDADGIEDLAVSFLPSKVDRTVHRGGVVVFFGNQTVGLKNAEKSSKTALIRETWTRFPTMNFFGGNLQSGDLNGDNYDDLVISAATDPVAGTRSGSVSIAFGNSSWKNNRPQLFKIAPNHKTERGHFGGALAVGNFDYDDRDELVVGMSGSNIAGPENSGAVVLLNLQDNGQFSQQTFYQSLNFIPGKSEQGDGFGRKLTAADFNNDGIDDLAIGIELENRESWFNTIYAHGAVVVMYGNNNGLYTSQVWHQDITGVEGVREDKDWFGIALSTGDFNNDGFVDLLVGVSGENIESQSKTDAGIVQMIWGSNAGLTAAIPGQQSFNHGSFSGEGFRLRAYENFGNSLLQ